jgi:DNA-binding response OmpR family regulator
MPSDHPTVLVAVEETESRGALVQKLRQDGYLVLEAADSTGTLNLVRTHSRPIQVILLSATLNRSVLRAALKQYRPHSSVLVMSENNNERVVDVLTSEVALTKIRELFKP